MKGSISLSTIILSLVASAAVAQAPPPPQKVLVIIREQVKPGREVVHERTEAGWPRAYAKAKSPVMYFAYTSMSGPPFVDFVTGYPSFEAWQQDIDWQAKNASLTADLNALGQPDGEHLSGMRRWVAVYDESMSYQPAVDWSKARYAHVLTFRLRPGFEDGFGEVAKLYAGAYQKAGVDGHWATYSVMDGEKTPTFFVVTSMRSLAELDKTMMDDPKIFAAMGAEGAQKAARFAKDAILESESALVAANPAMSYVTKEFAAGDPAFWTPKPTARAVSMNTAARDTTKRANP